MNLATHPPTQLSPEDDPVAAALQNPSVRTDLMAQALCRLNRWLADRPKLLRIQEAEIAVDETMARAWEKRAAFDPVRDLGGWLHGILTNVIAEQCRKLRKQPIQSEQPLERATWDHFESLEPGTLTRFVARLPEADRNLVVWACIDELSHKEISERLNINAANSRQRLRRLLAEMKRECSALLREGNR